MRAERPARRAMWARQSRFFAELLNANAAALLRGDPFGPLFWFRLGRRLLADTVAHDTTIQHRPTPPEERFTGRLRLFAIGTGGSPKAPGAPSSFLQANMTVLGGTGAYLG